MAVSYGGIYIPFASAEAIDWVESRLSLRDAAEFAAVDHPGRYRTSWTPDPAFIPDRPIRIGTLFFPPDASRFAVAHFLVDDATLDAVRALAYAGGYQSLTFTLDDGVSDPVATALYMLPARPLDQRSGAVNLYLLTLVDARFFWWFRSAEINISTGTAWADLFADIGAALGVTITTDPIPAAYLAPAPVLTSRYEFVPLLLDAACRAIGMRLVRFLNGAVKVMSAGSALTSQAAQVAEWDKEAGGTYSLVG